MFSKLALGAIWGYQQYVSPRKGFRCAYSVHHGGTGCSGYAKYAIRDHGLWRAIPIIRQRLRDCKAAYEDIKSSCTCRSEPLNEDARAERERRRKKDGKCNAGDFCIGCGDCGGCGGSAARSAGSSKMCDLNPCDGDIGCGSCDACSCDVCSCGG
ncbi:membrane protein insertion efficiency factor YidD [uncultured Litoreibacter sp.]|uniref:membrane protein insertion efficiency factor YidD n=1 Tax=uncultured Litoreibacter sp. TaxID=1392394 RepID=UPI002608CE1C|nr:membrane protein insertion efficiency factor YidD [uncultured Litoreibacter sp.]